MPQGWVLLGLKGAAKGHAYIPTTNRIVRWYLRGDDFKATPVGETVPSSIQAVGFSPMNDAIFGLEVLEDGSPDQFVPLMAGERHRMSEPLNLTDAVLRAKTVRIDP